MTRMKKMLISVVVLMVTAPLAFADHSPIKLSIEGSAADKPTQWSPAELRSRFAAQSKVVEYESHGAKHTSTCVPLITVLEAAGVPITLKMDPKADPKTKHRPLRIAVLAEGTDGYAVLFSLAEMLPDIGGKDVWVAIDQDGQPLPDRDAPIKLIVLSDAKPARWIHAVDRLTVTELKASATTQPSP